MDDIIEFINSDIDDNVVVDLIDSIPSDKLHELFEINDKKIQKYRGLYSNILSQKDFNYTFDEQLNVVTDTILVDSDVRELLDLDSETYFSDVMKKFDDYVKENKISDGLNKEMLEIFKDELQYLNYDKLDSFKRALLLVPKTKLIYK